MIDRMKEFAQERKARGTKYALKRLSSDSKRLVSRGVIRKRVWLEHKSWKLVLVLCALELVEFVQWLS